MLEICAFKENCPMDSGIIEIAGACSSQRGEKCGKVAAFGMLKWQFQELVDLDDMEPIEGTFTITEVPDGFPPQAIREEWVGVQLPMRNMQRCQESGEVEISPADAILSLLNSGRLNAAEWFIKANIRFSPLEPSWVFKAADGQVQSVDTTSSADYYGSNLTPEMIEAIGR